MHYFTPKRCATSNKIMYHDKAQAQRAADQSLIERGGRAMGVPLRILRVLAFDAP